jgi:hypothetical protein
MTRQVLDPIFLQPGEHERGSILPPLRESEERASMALEATQDQLSEVRELLNEVAMYTSQLLTHVGALEQGQPAPAWMTLAEVIERIWPGDRGE